MTYLPAAQLATLVAAVVAAIASLYNARFSKFTREKWWERQADAYERIIQLLAEIQFYYWEHLSSWEDNVQIPQTEQDELLGKWKSSNAALRRATAVGAFLISESAWAALREFRKHEIINVQADDWYRVLESNLDATEECLSVVVGEAKRDLNSPASPLRRRIWERLSSGRTKRALPPADMLK